MSDSESELGTQPTRRAISVTTGSRLHFGLLRTTAPFGGLGVMIDSPRTAVAAIEAEQFGCDIESAGDSESWQRVVQIAQRFATFHGLQDLPACRISVNERPPAHSGLGSGTQLSMAVADALSQFYSFAVSHESLARDIAGRGERSAVGIHGYFQGGILFEDSPGDECLLHAPSGSVEPKRGAGDRAETSPHLGSTLLEEEGEAKLRDLRRGEGTRTPSINPIVARGEVPSDWRVALFRPRVSIMTVSGDREQQHFLHTQSHPQQSLERLVTIAQHEILPAVNSSDFDSFADAVQRFNRESGLLFESVQGGPYNGPLITRLVEELQSLGAVGVGQSSWGPSVFCWFANDDQAREFVERVPNELASGFITGAKNSPRCIAK